MKKLVLKTYINVMKDMYEGSCTSVQNICGRNKEFQSESVVQEGIASL